MKNPVIEELGDGKYYIGLDYSRSNGILHFTHEISVCVHKDSDGLEILDADEINSDGWITYTSKELEDEYPGILKVIEEVLTNYENSKQMRCL